METAYKITISMNQNTAEQLKLQGFSLFGFKAVSTPVGSGVGAPLVWFTSTAFGLQVEVDWSESYAAYTSTQQIAKGTVITASSSYPIGLGQRLAVTSPVGTGTVLDGTMPTAIQLKNTSGTGMIGGIGQLVNGKATPLCAFPLDGKEELDIQPIEQVALMFATGEVNTGSVVMQAFTDGALLDLTASNSVTVTYDIEAGWSLPSCPMTAIDEDDNMAPLLLLKA